MRCCGHAIRRSALHINAGATDGVLLYDAEGDSARGMRHLGVAIEAVIILKSWETAPGSTNSPYGTTRPQRTVDATRPRSYAGLPCANSRKEREKCWTGSAMSEAMTIHAGGAGEAPAKRTPTVYLIDDSDNMRERVHQRSPFSSTARIST